MRRSLISLWLIALMSNAFAADYELPVLRGSTPFVPAPPVYTRWSGYYVGGQLSASIAGGDFASSVGSLVSYAVRNSVLESRVSNWTTLPKDYRDTGDPRWDGTRGRRRRFPIP